MAEEQPLGETQRLRAGKQQLLGLLALLIDLLGGQGHGTGLGWKGRRTGGAVRGAAPSLPSFYLRPARPGQADFSGEGGRAVPRTDYPG